MSSHNESRYVVLALSQKERVGPVTFKQLLGEDLKLDKLKVSQKFNWQDLVNIGKKHEAELSKLAVGVVCFDDLEYPKLLSQIYDPPIAIYYKGNLDILQNKLASVVGTRRMSVRAKQNSKYLGETLSANGITVVSGLAFGVDAQVHLAAAGQQGKTIAVLPMGVQKALPSSNQFIYKKILDNGGLVLSEFSAELGLAKGMFPRRNRIIAGLSLATVVVEAGLVSGALITARQAFGYGREVFAYPAEPGYESTGGCNLLIKNSIAQLIESPRDIFDYFGWAVDKQVGLAELNDQQRLLVKLINQKPHTLDQICDILDWPIAQTITAISGLELKGLIFANQDSCYCISK
jgi:DNA processing protein